jgi:hypothetical protein
MWQMWMTLSQLGMRPAIGVYANLIAPSPVNILDGCSVTIMKRLPVHNEAKAPAANEARWSRAVGPIQKDVLHKHTVISTPHGHTRYLRAPLAADCHRMCTGPPKRDVDGAV